MHGHSADPSTQGEDIDAIRAFDDFVAQHFRVEAVMLRIGDGRTLLRKKG